MAHHLAAELSAFAWGPEGKQAALCPNTNEIWIYTGTETTDHKKWKKSYVLKAHELVVSSLDWHPTTGLLLSCSHDRQAFVWKYHPDTDSWENQFVVLGFPRAALSATWNPEGDRFLVTSAYKHTAVFVFDNSEEANFWAREYLIQKHHKSSVLDGEWNPADPSFIATVGTDRHCRVFQLVSSSTKKNQAPKIQDYEASAWVTSCAWSPDGKQLAFTAHDSTVHIASPGSGKHQWVSCSGLPFTSCMWVSNSAFVAGGHDMRPALFSEHEGEWRLEKWYDSEEKKSSTKKSSAFAQARTMFKGLTERGEKKAASSGITTKHQGQIIKIIPKEATGGAGGGNTVTKFTTLSAEGRLCNWKVQPNVARYTCL